MTLLLALLLSDASTGKALVAKYGCEACHQIPGVGRATGRVGPSLEGVGARGYLAGRVINTRVNLVRWIRNPKQVDGRTLMPNLEVSGKDAQSIADFLYTLR